MLVHMNEDPMIVEACGILSDACHLSMEILSKLPFVGEKFDVISTFAIDCVSASVVAVRVALWGNPPEAMSILRCAIERSAQLMYIVGEAKYKTAGYEIDKGSFDQVSYETAVKKMGTLGQRIDKLRGLISGDMAHATVVRLRWSVYEKDGKQCARIGSSNCFPGVLGCLSYAMDVLIVVLDRLRAAYAGDNLPFEFEGTVNQINDRYKAFKPRCEETLRKSMEQSVD